jgi:hypothetical protein
MVACWDKQQTNCILESLLKYMSEAGDGGNYTMATLNKVASEIPLHLQTMGPRKTGQMVKRKWFEVCSFSL